MINGAMAEAQKGFAVLEEVDEGTIKRFIEWAYKGYYTAADFELEDTIHLSPVLPKQEKCEISGWTEGPTAESSAVTTVNYVELDPTIEIEWGSGTSAKSKWGKKAKMSQELKESFLHRKYTVRREVISIPPTRANRGANEDYTEVFLCHARLYVWAEKYDIQTLKTLAFEELHRTLAIYTLYRERTGDIVALLRYIYANTGVRAKGGKDLRTLLRDYIEYEMSVLMKDEDFQGFMIEDGGPLLQDFVKMVAKRID